MRIGGFPRLLALALVLWLVGCAFVPLPESAGECAGQVNTPPVGLVEVSDDALLMQAVKPSAEGGLCTGKVFQVSPALSTPIKVYRVWDKTRPYTAYGRWWSFDRPLGPRYEYRLANDICPKWSPLDQMSVCELRPGAKIVVGPGQSARCPSGAFYPPSAVNQVYIPNDSMQNILWVENCTPGVDWPRVE